MKSNQFNSMSEDKHIRIRVVPKSSETYVEKSKDDGPYIVYVRSAAKAGRANEEAIQLIRDFLRIDGQIRIVSGHHSPSKILEIANT